MRDRIDAEAIQANANIVTVIEKHVSLKKKGYEYIGMCPFHQDEKPSLQVNETKQIFKCFACGVGGDAIHFLRSLGYTFEEALKELNNGEVVRPDTVIEKKVLEKKAPEWTQVLPTERLAGISHHEHGTPSRVWQYTTVDGSLIGYICRFDKEDGKEVLPYTYVTNGIETRWKWKGFDAPRPLYNLHNIVANPSATIMVVEGEKTAEAAKLLFPKAIVTCWIGGGQAFKHTNWSPLEGRKVILWPDNDAPGIKTMNDLAAILSPMCKVVKIVSNPPDAPKHWDLADADWTSEYANEYAKANMQDAVFEAPTEEHHQEEEYHYEMPPLPPDEFHSDSAGAPDEPIHFRFLGFTNNGGSLSHNFYSHGSRTVLSLSPSGMSKNNLLELAPLNWWEESFPGNKKGVNMEAAANWLIHTSMNKGVFSDRFIRGRGAWLDKSNVVIHTGEKLIVNGTSTDMRDFTSRYIYEFSEPLGFNTIDPLPTSEANKLVSILELLNWDREINAYLLAGWCIVAPICGALSWRPHIWLTGAAGTGKSWVFKNIVRKLMGETVIAVQGETSEAGLRQMLGHDALPVVFDEAEGEDRRSQDRMQSVLSLMRAASADDGGIMAKGSSSGTAKTYRIRSCFAFASIAVQVSQQSDRTRVTMLGLRKATDAEKDVRWKHLNSLYQHTVTEEFVRRLHSRTVKLLPTIIENARTFSNAAAAELGEQRVGDQLGALLSGAYSLFSNSLISYDDAVKWIVSKDWSEEKGLDRTRDEIALLTYLLDQIVRVETSHGTYERNISELVSSSALFSKDEVLLPSVSIEKLRRLGLKTEGDYLVVSNTADWIKKTLRDTAWAKNHNKILSRIDGSKAYDSTRFGPGIQTRAVGIPLSTIFDEVK